MRLTVMSMVLALWSCSAKVSDIVHIRSVDADVPPRNRVSIRMDDCWLENQIPNCIENNGVLTWISSPPGSSYNQSHVDNCTHIFDVDSCLPGEYIFECTVEGDCIGCGDEDTATLTLTSDGNMVVATVICN